MLAVQTFSGVGMLSVDLQIVMVQYVGGSISIGGMFVLSIVMWVLWDSAISHLGPSQVIVCLYLTLQYGQCRAVPLVIWGHHE